MGETEIDNSPTKSKEETEKIEKKDIETENDEDKVNPLENIEDDEKRVELKSTLRKSYLTNDETSGDEKGGARGRPKK